MTRQSSGGFLVTPHDIPSERSSSVNFTFSFGSGIEWFRDQRHSWSIDDRIHHLSNAGIGYSNAGIDSQLLRLTYTRGH